MTVPGNIDALLLGGQRGYQIERSLRFNSADSAYLTRTPASASGYDQWTFSCWFKRLLVGDELPLIGGNTTTSGGTRNELVVKLNSSDQLGIWAFNNSSGYYFYRFSQSVYRDPSAWYHLVVQFDPDNGTSANKIIAYMNGVQVTWGSSADSGAGGSIGNSGYRSINNTYRNDIGGGYQGGGAPIYFTNAYMTEIHMVSGSIVAPSSFGETDTITGVWKPKRYSGTYTGNSFYLKFADNSGTTSTTLGKDSSGLGNHFTPNNFSVTAGAGNDSMIDTPTPYADGGNGRGNYCTLNPLSSSSVATLSNGNLDVNTGTTGGGLTLGTFAMPQSGKWYWEVTPTSIGLAACRIGIANTLRDTNVEYYNDGTKVVNDASTSYGASYTDNDVIGIACDIGGNTVTFYKNNSSQGSISFSSWSTVTVFPMIADGSGSLGLTATFNFGQRPFAYTPPSGFLALNTQNLPEPSIKKPSSYFSTVLYTGNGTSQSLSAGFASDLVWVKNRSTANSHQLTDSVRGNTNALASDLTIAEYTGEISLTGSGFSVSGNANATNKSSESYVAWCWDESATPGFDIVTYTGDGTTSANRLIDHSLGVKPDFVITKKRSGGTDYGWSCWHKDLGGNYGIFLNSTSARNSGMWTGYSNFSATKFTPPDLLYGNENGATYVNYLWSEVAGFSKFGSYTGNNSSDGPFIFCGFRPRLVIAKPSSGGTGDWAIIDTSRNPYNISNAQIWANSSSAENSTVDCIDILSNGFKVRASSISNFNASGVTYVFVAFAESPAKYSLAR